MKRIHLFLLVFVIPLWGLSQQSLLQKDRLWSMVETHCLPRGNTYTSHYLKPGQDTVINGESYTNLRYSQDETQNIWYDYGGFIRETPEGKVYFMRIGLPEGLIYDFGAQIGDTVVVLNQELIPEPIHFVVISEDSLLLEDGWHRMMVLEDEAFPGEEVWIEGVGSISGLVKSGLNAFGSTCGDFDLLCSSDDAIAIYMNPEYPTCWYVYTRIGDPILGESLLLYPNPVRDVLNIEGEFLREGESYLIRISDYTGRIVFEQYMSNNEVNISDISAGMYFLNIQSEAGNYTGKILKN